MNDNKKCSACKEIKPFSDFYKSKSQRCGYQSRCIDCSLSTSIKYGETINGKCIRAWNSINWRAENRSGKHQSYTKIKVLITKEEFMNWAIPAYTKWIELNPNGRPSVDRIDNLEHYKIENLRVIDRKENSSLSSRNKTRFGPVGTKWCGRCEKYLQKEQFNKDSSKPCGLSSWCKLCCNKGAK